MTYECYAKLSINNIVSYVIPKTQEEIVNFEHSFDVDGKLQINNFNGDINVIKTWNKQQIVIEVVKKGVDKELAQVTFDTSFSSQVASITTRQPTKNKTAVTFNIIMPAHVKLDLKTDKGCINVNSAADDISAITEEGSIILNDTIGSVFARTDDGELTVKTKRLKSDQSIVLENQDGNISLHLPDSTQGNLQAKTYNGKVTSDLHITLASRTTKINQQLWDSVKREVVGKLGHGNSDIKLLTYNGNIKILEY